MALNDRFKRKHDYLRISLTEKCNLRCRYCMPAEGVQLSPAASIMTADEIAGIATVFQKLGVTKVRLTGGEPLLRRDFENIARSLSNLGLELALTTNALLVHKYIDLFEELGLRSINVSLDTLKAEKFNLITRKPQFEQTMRNIQLMIDRRLKVKINVVVMRDFNEDEILDFVRWTENSSIHVRFIEFMPFDGNAWQWQKMLPYREMLEMISSSFEIARLSDEPHSTSKAHQVKGFGGTFSVISSMTDHFCASCNRMRLTANGMMKNCLFATGETDLLNPFRAGENIEALIRSCLEKKHFKHGGIEDLEALSGSGEDRGHRSMIMIGG